MAHGVEIAEADTFGVDEGRLRHGFGGLRCREARGSLLGPPERARSGSFRRVAVPRIVPYLESADFAAVKAFYVDVLGLEVAMEDPDMPDFLGFCSPDNHSAQIVVAAAGVEQPLPSFGVDVGSLAAVDAAHAEALRRGLEVVYPPTDEPWGIRRFLVRDPGGAVINVLAHRSGG